MASRCTTAFVDPPIAASATIALWKLPFVRKVLGRRSSSTSCTRQPPGVVRRLEQPSCRARECPRPRARPCRAPRPRSAIVDAVPIVLQCPLPADHRRLGLQEVELAQRARAHLLAEAPDVGAAAERLAAEVAGEHRAARHHDRGHVDRGRGHQQRAGSSCRSRPAAPRRRPDWRRSISSVAIAAMLRHSIAVGRTCVSPSDTTGRSSGMPPGLVDRRS